MTAISLLKELASITTSTQSLLQREACSAQGMAGKAQRTEQVNRQVLPFCNQCSKQEHRGAACHVGGSEGNRAPGQLRIRKGHPFVGDFGVWLPFAKPISIAIRSPEFRFEISVGGKCSASKRSFSVLTLTVPAS